MRIAVTAAVMLLLSACATMNRQFNREGELIDSPTRDWRAVATSDDQARLRGWRTAFIDGLKSAAASHAADVAAQGALLSPDAALPGPALPDGSYACRTIKLGARSAGMLDYVAYPAFTCRVRKEGAVQRLVKLSGSQRPLGLLFPHDALHSVFLGTLMLGDEVRPLQYGSDSDRNLAGFVERIGPRRWRLILPSPRFESKIDVIELVPAS